MDDSDFNSDAFNVPASETGSDFPSTIDEAANQIATQMAPFVVSDTKINDEDNMDTTGFEDATSNADNSSDFGSAVGDFFDSIVSDFKSAASDVAKAAIAKGKQSATQSLNKPGSSTSKTTTTKTTTNTSKTTVLGMTPQTALIAALAVGVLVYVASRNRGALTA